MFIWVSCPYNTFYWTPCVLYKRQSWIGIYTDEFSWTLFTPWPNFCWYLSKKKKPWAIIEQLVNCNWSTYLLDQKSSHPIIPQSVKVISDSCPEYGARSLVAQTHLLLPGRDPYILFVGPQLGSSSWRLALHKSRRVLLTSTTVFHFHQSNWIYCYNIRTEAWTSGTVPACGIEKYHNMTWRILEMIRPPWTSAVLNVNKDRFLRFPLNYDKTWPILNAFSHHHKVLHITL